MASDLMAGNLPPAVKKAIFRLSSAKSFSGWGGGGGSGEALALRDIGVGTLEAMQGGANLFQSGFTRFCPAEMIMLRCGLKKGD